MHDWITVTDISKETGVDIEKIKKILFGFSGLFTKKKIGESVRYFSDAIGIIMEITSFSAEGKSAAEIRILFESRALNETTFKENDNKAIVENSIKERDPIKNHLDKNLNRDIKLESIEQTLNLNEALIIIASQKNEIQNLSNKIREVELKMSKLKINLDKNILNMENQIMLKVNNYITELFYNNK